MGIVKIGEKAICLTCDKEFITRSTKQKYCSEKCKAVAGGGKQQEKRLDRKSENAEHFDIERYVREAKKAPCERYETCFVCEENDCIWDE